jgi:Cu/Ag efflux protein CusF
MKTDKILNVILAIILTITICLTAGPASAAREIWQIISVTAEVLKVEPEKREITLKDPLGDVTILSVDKRVKRLDEIKAGDKVELDYYVSLASEIREPTAEEKENPITVLAIAAKAPPGTAPAAGGLRQIKAVVNVVRIDRSAEMVTLKGPLGNSLTIKVLDPSRLEKVNVGDTVIVLYTEGLAVRINKLK